jgi:hypothetical protein
MDDLDRLLRDAGAHWRAAQPPPPAIGDFAPLNARQVTAGWPSLAAAGAMGAAVAVIVMLAFGVWTQGAEGPRVGAGAPAATSPGSPAITAEACDVTRPNPSFAAPSPYPSSPPDGRSAWFGTPQLWTMLDPAGQVWDGGMQKTFWWSSDWPGQRLQPEPPITVVATRLDGPGTARGEPGTNAAADDLGGQAMLVGIDIPASGCWQLTAQYRSAVLSYVVWIK